MLARGLCGLALFVGMVVSAAEVELERQPIAIVVSASWKTPSEIQFTTLRRVYRGRVTRWAGREVERYELAPGSAARSAFAAIVMGQSERELEDYWLEQALTGGAIPPREVDGIAEMRRTIADRAGSIGYLPLAALEPKDAHQLRILGVQLDGTVYRPDDPRYPIQMPARIGTPPSDD
jgi:ABC-type phosphate transport system substrate-binding protein